MTGTCLTTQSGARSIHIAARRGHVGVVQTLLQKGEQVDTATHVSHDDQLLSLNIRK